MERCLSDSEEGKKAISLAWHFAKYLAVAPEEGRKFEAEDIYGAGEEIAELLEKGSKALWGTDDFAKVAWVSDSLELEQLCKRFPGELEDFSKCPVIPSASEFRGGFGRPFLFAVQLGCSATLIPNRFGWSGKNSLSRASGLTLNL
jgi:hypothetical protein